MKKVKIKKEALKAILATEWWLFLLIPLVVSGTFFYLFYLLDKPKDNEKIRIFSGFEITENFNKRLYKDYLNDFKNYGILEVSTYWLDESTTTYALNFGNSIFSNYEIIISSQDEYELNKGMYNNLCLFVVFKTRTLFQKESSYYN